MPTFNSTGIALYWSTSWCGSGSFVCIVLYQVPSAPKDCTVAQTTSNYVSTQTIGPCSGTQYGPFFWSENDPIVSLTGYNSQCSSVSNGLVLTRASGTSFSFGQLSGAVTGPTSVATGSRGGPVFVQTRSGSALDQVSLSFLGPAATLSCCNAGYYFTGSACAGSCCWFNI